MGEREEHCMNCHHQFVCELRRNTSMSAASLRYFCAHYWYDGPVEDAPCAVVPEAEGGTEG
jgi:hypothetical protein